MIADRVKEFSTTTGTGAFTLTGAVTGFEGFNTAFGVGPSFDYCIESIDSATGAPNGAWEIGSGHLSGATTLVRDTVRQSSNADALVAFTSGTKNVFCTLPASVIVALQTAIDAKVAKAGDTMTGALVVNGSVRSTTGAVLAVADVTATQPAFYLADEVGTNQCALYWLRSPNSLRFWNRLAPNEIALLANGIVQIATGFQGRAGYSGSYDSSAHNINWNSVSGSELWIDNTNLGNIQLVCDYRIKKDVVPLARTWDAVKALNPISYTQAQFTPASTVALRAQQAREANTKVDTTPMFVADEVERWGFIAHELQETLLPSAAHGEKDSPTEIQTLNVIAVVAALTRALQEAMARIEVLEGVTSGG